MQAWLYPGKQIKYQVTYSQREKKAVVPFQQAYRFSNVHKKYTGRYLILTENGKSPDDFLSAWDFPFSVNLYV